MDALDYLTPIDTPFKPYHMLLRIAMGNYR